MVYNAYYQDIQQDKFRLLEYVNHFNFDQSIFILEDYLVKYNLNLDEILEEFVMEALLAKIKIEYQRKFLFIKFKYGYAVFNALKVFTLPIKSNYFNIYPFITQRP